MTRWWALVLGVVVGVGLIVFGGLALSDRLTSPQQSVADAAPPDPSLVTATIERRVVSDDLVFRGTPIAGSGASIQTPPSPEGVSAVVTATPVSAGQRVGEGSVLVEISGRPVIVLQGAFPAYRTLTGGVAGPDVRQVQEALGRLGYMNDVDGIFGPVTQAAVQRLYQDRGYQPAVGDPRAADGLGAAAEASAQAQAALFTALQTPGADVTAAQQAATEAADHLDEVRLAAGPSFPDAEVAFVPDLPITVSGLDVTVGQRLGSQAETLAETASGAAAVEIQVPADLADDIAVGDRVEARDEGTGRTVRLTVASIVGDAGSQPSGREGQTVRLEPVEGATVPPDRSMQVTVRVGASGSPVLAAPVSAVYSRADGSTFVTVVGADNELSDVPVSTKRPVGGWVEITGSDGRHADLVAPGATVVVGLGTVPGSGGGGG